MTTRGSGKAVSHLEQAGRVFLCCFYVVDRAGPDDDEEAVVGAVEDTVDRWRASKTVFAAFSLIGMSAISSAVVISSFMS
jgi:hypothetical protein